LEELFGQELVTEEVMAAVPANDFRTAPAVIQSPMERCNEWELVPLLEWSTVQLWTASLPHQSDTLPVAWLLHLARRGTPQDRSTPNFVSRTPGLDGRSARGPGGAAQVPARGAMTAPSATLPCWRRRLVRW
jgi:hypothetical protein